MNNKSPIQNIVGTAVYALTGNIEGFTIKAQTGEHYTGSQWLVGGIIPGLILTDQQSAESIIEQVTEWYRGVEALDGDGGLIGGWMSDGKLHLDLVSLMSSEEEAIILSKLWNQMAYGRIIDGTFTEYTLTTTE